MSCFCLPEEPDDYTTHLTPINLAIVLGAILIAVYKVLTHPAGAAGGLMDALFLFIWAFGSLIGILEVLFKAASNDLSYLA